MSPITNVAEPPDESPTITDGSDAHSALRGAARDNVLVLAGLARPQIAELAIPTSEVTTAGT